jgi:DNA-binding MarR family transcriptional regulator
MRTADILDDTITTWSERRPDLDFDGMTLILKMGAVVRQVTESLRAEFEELGVTVAEFDVLATLRRTGSDSALTPSLIAEVAMVKPSGLSHRLNRLEAAGLIERTLDPDDRRSSLVRMTPAGRRVVDRAIEIVVVKKNTFCSALDGHQRQSLQSLLDLLIVGADC